MTQSATSRSTTAAQRRRDRLYLVQEHACRLVIDRGYDGFTMDDLAAAAGVSRRTLFNLVKDKAASVLGPPDITHHQALEDFRKGGPTGNLQRDVETLVDRVMREKSDDPEAMAQHALMEQAMAADPKVRGIVTDRFTEFTEFATVLICEREGWVIGDRRARALATVLLALSQMTVSELDPTAGGEHLADLFAENLRATRAVLDLGNSTNLNEQA
ncbi:TetR/AcrR family transcriptional regulator [Dermacoccaceae bacterium W4C1]